jgi:photosystem II stability/assembly factor-like uncharacterized protein
MKVIKHILFFLLIAQQSFSQKINFKKIEIDTNFAFRGLSVVDDNVAWVSGIKGKVGRSTDGGKSWKFASVKGFEHVDFRTIYAFNDKEAIIANAGTPAHIMRTNDGGKNWNIVYTNKDSLAFIDGTDFWNDKDGMVYGDAIKGHMLLVQTKDGGKTWEELPEQSRPAMVEGEGSFAASGTGIRCYGKEKVFVCTGGKVSRLLVSNDKGKSWSNISPPIIQGQNSTGIFSVAFENDLDGIVVGGDYKKDLLKENHVFYTRDGGKTWKAPNVATGGGRGCVEFIGKNLAIAPGVGGMDISSDGGITWTAIENQKNFYVIRKARKGNLMIAAGFKKLSVVTQ